MIARIRRRLRQYGSPPPQPGEWPEAAVLMALTSGLSPELLLTVRADELPSHAGEVAFPGGKRDPGDAGLIDTALREAREEVGLDRDRLEILGQLQPRISRFGLQVSPFVALMVDRAPLVPNPAEIAEMFYVPLGFFLDRRHLHMETHMVRGIVRDVPGYEYQGRHIWGLTAVFIVDLLNTVFEFGVAMRR